MNTEAKLDKVIDILYDENQLIFKKIPTTDIVIFGKTKYNLNWSEAEVLLIMDVLQDEGYVLINKGDFSGNNLKPPTYSLTSKGIRLKQNGGFVFKRRIEWLKNSLIILASIVTILVGIATSLDLYNKYFSPTKPTNQTENCNCITNPKITTQMQTKDTHNKESHNNKESKQNSNKNINNTVTKSDSIPDSIKKHNVGTTKK